MYKVLEVGFGKEGCVKKIGTLIAPFLREFRMEEAVRFEGIKGAWGNIFREPLSLHMSPVSLKKGELLINVDSPLWLQQLSFLKNQIIDNLSPFEVKDLRFRVGRVVSAPNNAAQSSSARNRFLGSDALREIENVVSGINDDNIKEGIRKAMEKSLSARKTRP